MARRGSWADYMIKVSRGTIEGVKVSRGTTGQLTITAGAAPQWTPPAAAPSSLYITTYAQLFYFWNLPHPT